MNRSTRIANSLILPLLLLVLWNYVCVNNLVPASMLASPGAVLNDFMAMAKSGTLLTHCVVSLWRLLLGFLAGAGTGVLVGVLIALSPSFCRIAEPTISVLAPIPPIAWVPFIIMLLGIDDTAKIALIAVGTFFILVVHTTHGLRGVSRDFVELTEVLRKNKMELLLFVLLPAALPEIFTGLRISMGLCWTLLLVSEIIASSNGLGWMIWDARNFSRPDDLIVDMIVVGILGRLTDILLAGIERRATSWKATFDNMQQYAS